MVFRATDRDTAFLLPPSVQDWLPEGHLARYVVEVVDSLDLSALERRYASNCPKAFARRSNFWPIRDTSASTTSASVRKPAWSP